MNEIIAIKIDVTKILADRLFAGKNGAKYLDAILIPSPDSRYGDSHFIAQSVSKEERAKGIKGPIIGNAKIIGGSRQDPRKPLPETETKTFMKEDGEDAPY
jgi:hypothetical protein